MRLAARAAAGGGTALQVARLEPHAASITCLGLSPRGSIVLSADADGVLKLSRASGCVLPSEFHRSVVGCACGLRCNCWYGDGSRMCSPLYPHALLQLHDRSQSTLSVHTAEVTSEYQCTLRAVRMRPCRGPPGWCGQGQDWRMSSNDFPPHLASCGRWRPRASCIAFGLCSDSLHRVGSRWRVCAHRYAPCAPAAASLPGSRSFRCDRPVPAAHSVSAANEKS
jgi:hypothetical protein